MSEQPQTIVVRADLDEYPRLLGWIEGFVAQNSVPSATSFAIQLCLEEAFSNIVRHGYTGLEVGDRAVRVSLEHADAAILMTFEDHGIPFDPTAAATPAPAASLEDAIIGGQGIHLMRRFAQRLEYQRRGEQNWLRLHFALDASQGDS